MGRSAFFEEVTVAADFATDGGHDAGFVAGVWKLHLQSGGPVEYSFDGATVHGTLGPSGTRPMTVTDRVRSSRIWLQGAGTPVCSVWGQGGS